jgi:hypothetical protein
VRNKNGIATRALRTKSCSFIHSIIRLVLLSSKESPLRINKITTSPERQDYHPVTLAAAICFGFIEKVSSTKKILFQRRKKMFLFLFVIQGTIFE